MDIKNIIKEYYSQFYDNKVGEMGQLTEKYNLPKVTKNKTENASYTVNLKEIEPVILKKNVQERNQAFVVSLVNFIKHLKRK